MRSRTLLCRRVSCALDQSIALFLDFGCVVAPSGRSALQAWQGLVSPSSSSRLHFRFRRWRDPHTRFLKNRSLEEGLSSLQLPRSVPEPELGPTTPAAWPAVVSHCRSSPVLSALAHTLWPSVSTWLCGNRLCPPSVLPKCTIRAPCRRMDHVEPTFSLEAIDSQSGYGSSHTSVISAIVAIILSSSSPTALRNFFGNGDTSDFPTMFSEGSGDLGLVCLSGVVTQGSGTAVDNEEEDALSWIRHWCLIVHRRALCSLII